MARFAKGEISDVDERLRLSCVRLVKFAKGEISDIKVL